MYYKCKQQRLSCLNVYVMDDFVVRIFMTNLLAVFLSNQINCFDVQKNPDYTVKKLSFPRKRNFIPMLRISKIFGVEPLDFQSILPWPTFFFWNFQKFSTFLHWTPYQEIYVFFLKLSWNSSHVYSTPWNFPLISSIGEVKFACGKAQSQ